MFVYVYTHTHMYKHTYICGKHWYFFPSVSFSSLPPRWSPNQTALLSHSCSFLKSYFLALNSIFVTLPHSFHPMFYEFSWRVWSHTDTWGLQILSSASVIILSSHSQFFLFYLFIFSFSHMCIQCLGHFSPFPPAPSFTYPTPSLSPPTPLLPGRNYFALMSNFVEEKV
jgi:hypothetical protein